MKYLIVNADDFGMTRGINEGILKSMLEGVVTSLSMLACGDAFADAVRLARSHGIREVGVHLSITELTPITLPKTIKNHKLLFAKLLSGGIKEGDIRREFGAQIERIRGEGLEVTHLDSHEHIHMMPQTFRTFIEVAREYRIPAIRFLREEKVCGRRTPNKLYRLSLSRYFSKRCERELKHSGLAHPDRVLGFLDSGNLSEGLLIEMLGSIDEGLTELICHPGFLSPEILERFRWHRNCEDELFALTSRALRRAIEERRVTLCGYKTAMELSRSPSSR